MSIDKPICVIGSNSFSGASFCSHLLKQGYKVLAISRSLEPINALLPYKWIEHYHLQFEQLDINHQLKDIIRLLDRYKISHVYNFAAQSMVGQSWENPEHWFTTNVVSTVNLHKHLQQKDYLERYIHVSTPEVYGSCSGVISEHKTYYPSTPYAVSRAASDMSLHTFFDAYDFPVVFTRAANVYGEGQQLYRIIPRTIMYILMNRKLELHGGGLSERSFIHIDDVCSATKIIGDKGNDGSIYHISTKRTVTIKDLVQLICTRMNYLFNDLCVVSEDRIGKDFAYLLSSEKLTSELLWQDKISLEDGIDRTIKWVKSNFSELSKTNLEYIHKA